MATVTIQEAQANLSHVIHQLTPGDEVLITENNQPVGRLLPTTSQAEQRKIPLLGTLRGTVLSMEHFDDPLDDFNEYVE